MSALLLTRLIILYFYSAYSPPLGYPISLLNGFDRSYLTGSIVWSLVPQDLFGFLLLLVFLKVLSWVLYSTFFTQRTFVLCCLLRVSSTNSLQMTCKHTCTPVLLRLLLWLVRCA